MSDRCIRCNGINDSERDLCPTCFFGDVVAMQFSAEHQELIKSAKAIREYWDMPLEDKEAVETIEANLFYEKEYNQMLSDGDMLQRDHDEETKFARYGGAL